MITSVHAIMYADDAEAARAFLRDVLGLPFVDDGQGDGWLIFQLPPAELGVHPVEGSSQPSGAHQMYLMCDDITATVEQLKSKGVEFTSDITDQGWGLATTLKVPGAGALGLYEPRHQTAVSQR